MPQKKEVPEPRTPQNKEALKKSAERFLAWLAARHKARQKGLH